MDQTLEFIKEMNKSPLNIKKIEEMLKRKNVNINIPLNSEGLMPIQKIVFENYENLFDLLISPDIYVRDKYGYTLLFYAIKANNPRILEKLIQKGLNVNGKNKKGETPLIFAINNNSSVNIIKILLKYNANTNVVDFDGTTPVTMCIYDDKPEILELFLQHKETDINKRDKKTMQITPLMLACSENKENIVKLLLEYGADVNLQDENGLTALIHSNNNNIIELLLKYGADVNLSTNNGKTVFDYAEEIKTQEGIEILKTLLNSIKKSDIESTDDICINYDADDFLNSEQFKDTPFFVLMIDDTRYCLSTEWVRFMEDVDNIMADWIQNPDASGIMTSTGFYGMAGKQRFHKLSPGFTFYIDHKSFLIMKDKIEENKSTNKRKYCIFILGDNRKMRLGNTRSLYGTSMLHGQQLEDVYSLEGFSILDRKALLEFKMNETQIELPYYIKGMSCLSHLKGLGKDIYIFGEKHKGLSECLEKYREEYIEVDEFIELLSKSKNEKLDIFVESDYVSEKGIFKPNLFTRDGIPSGLDDIQFTYQDCLTGERSCFIDNLRFHFTNIRVISSFYRFGFKLNEQKNDEDINKYLSILLRTGFDKLYDENLLLEQSKITKQLEKINNIELKDEIIKIIKRKLKKNRQEITKEMIQRAIDDKTYYRNVLKIALDKLFLFYFNVIFDGYIVSRMMKEYTKYNYVFVGDLHRKGIRDILLELGFVLEKEYEDDTYTQCLPISDFKF
jgi:ankyrin repeat protein